MACDDVIPTEDTRTGGCEDLNVDCGERSGEAGRDDDGVGGSEGSACRCST